jgi:catechol 2,3-dioxygenase-like lactoylglutathione lyase family enzyme
MITVNGIAGVFLYSNDPQKLAEWYTHNFGLEFYADLPDIPYMVFHHRDDRDHTLRRSTVFSIMPAKKPLGSERGEYMINYRVDDLAGFLQQLQANGVETAAIEEHRDGRTEESTGYFSWIQDPEGNHIELYQPRLE